MQAYLVCLDDLKLLGIAFTRKLTTFTRLLEDLQEHGAKDETASLQGRASSNQSSALERVQWATRVVQEDKRHTDHMFEDLTQSLNAVSAHPVGITRAGADCYTALSASKH